MLKAKIKRSKYCLICKGDILTRFLSLGDLPLANSYLTKKELKKREWAKKIADYGAPPKAVTLLNFCNISNETIEYITDTTPGKQNLYLPGTHIPIVTPDMIKKDTPDYIIILAWNYAETILKNEKWFRKQGGKFIIPLPYPTIIG